ncbi:MAG TPA: type II toxin-antitoxin system prevent-host-death family antitoxin [Candidatus Acidoferrum sp.]|nr:type II toxin-antitoxin system prevent-host-death family antitoxin [Candidatus Acidoferrum sp.]
MKEIGAFEAKNKLAHLLDLAEKGEEIIITRHGKQVARLGPIQKTFDRAAARQAVEDIKKMRKGMHMDDATIRELIDEGRR